MSILLTRRQVAEALGVDVRSISNFQQEGMPCLPKRRRRPR